MRNILFMGSKKVTVLFVAVGFLFLTFKVNAQVPDPNRGLRADWMRGSLGLLWLPEINCNGNIEGVTIDKFLAQTKNLKTIDFIQVGLASPFIYSPVHTAPHPILESLWLGDTDIKGKPINLVVPRSTVADPFFGWIKAIRAAGLKTEVYVNSCNLLPWIGEGVPLEFPEFSNRWIAFCDSDPEVQAFIKSKPYHTDGKNDDRRPYMFAYAEFILKDYAIRYGDLIDAWCFDAAHVNMSAAGDIYTSANIEDQRIFQAFADAVHAGNPNAAVTFNNGVGVRGGDPYAKPSLFDDYKFGHPFGGAGNMVETEALYTANFGICEFMHDTNGLPYKNDGVEGTQKIVAHFFPKQSTTSWNDGGTPCLTDEEFVEWNHVGLIDGGGITWGTPLVATNLNNPGANLTLQPYALKQLEAVDADLSVNQFPGMPNWARQYTILPNAYVGQTYSHILREGVDFWDPEGNAIASLLASGNFPAWLTITETEEGIWTLSGNPTETVPTNYEFMLEAKNATTGTDRSVKLSVIENSAPIWIGDKTILPVAHIGEPYSFDLVDGVNFSDPDGDAITSVSIVSGSVSPSWLTITETTPGTWTLSGTPTETTPTDYQFGLEVSDATAGTVRIVNLNVLEYEIPSTMDVEIMATEDTNYGVDTVAKMYSAVQTAPDGLATFRVAIDVKPTAGKAIMSGVSGGPSTAKSWAIGKGVLPSDVSDFIFTGSDQEWVESINNITIVDFNANGGSLTLDKATSFFKSINILNAQSGQDFVAVKVGNATTDLGKLSTQTYTVELELVTALNNITSFAIGTGSTSTTNKWSVEGISVKIDFEGNSLSTNNPEMDAVIDFKLYPNPAQNKINVNFAIHEASIIDISGRIVKSYSDNTQSFNIADLAPGIYILQGMSDQDVKLVKRFVKNTN